MENNYFNLKRSRSVKKIPPEWWKGCYSSLELKEKRKAEFSSRWDSILPESVWQALLQYMGLGDQKLPCTCLTPFTASWRIRFAKMGGQFFLKGKWAVRFVNKTIVLPCTMHLQGRHHLQVALFTPQAASVVCVTISSSPLAFSGTELKCRWSALRLLPHVLRWSTEAQNYEQISLERQCQYLCTMVLQFRNSWVRCFLCLAVISELLFNCVRGRRGVTQFCTCWGLFGLWNVCQK